MNKTWITILALSATLGALAQGQVNFDTHVTSDIPPVHAPVIGYGGFPLTDGFGQLVIVGHNGSLTPLTPIGAFGTGAEAGYINAGPATAPPGFPGGTTVSLILRAWRGGPGSTYDTTAERGQSSPISVTLEESPNALNGLVGLNGIVFLPEPTTLALGALIVGATLLLRRRR